MIWIQMHIFHWTPPAVITDSGQNFANVIQGDLNAIRLEPAHGHSCNSKWSAHKCVLHVQYVAHCRAANIKMMIMHVEANPSSPGWMDGMAVNVQSMVLLSTQLEKQDAKPSQRRRRIKIIEATEMAEIDFSLVWWKFCQLCHQRQAMVQLLFLLNVVVIIPVFPVYVVLHKP